MGVRGIDGGEIHHRAEKVFAHVGALAGVEDVGGERNGFLAAMIFELIEHGIAMPEAVHVAGRQLRAEGVVGGEGVPVGQGQEVGPDALDIAVRFDGARSSGEHRRQSVNDSSDARRLELTAGYGIGMFGGRFTGTPEIGVGLSDSGRIYRVGWRLGLGSSGGTWFELGLEATRRESANDNETAHTADLRLGAT